MLIFGVVLLVISAIFGMAGFFGRQVGAIGRHGDASILGGSQKSGAFFWHFQCPAPPPASMPDMGVGVGGHQADAQAGGIGRDRGGADRG